MKSALQAVQDWSDDKSTSIISADSQAIRQFLEWMSKFQIGRKRVLDTMLAATYHSVGVTEVLTLNQPDFAVFNAFQFVEIRS